MDADNFLVEAEEYFADTARRVVRDRYEIASKRCESEIERILLAAMIAVFSDADFFRFMPMQGGFPVERIERFAGEILAFPKFGVVSIVPQTVIGPYRVDFLIHVIGDSGKRASIVVECDGHEFHERTKEQASRDRRRDRELQAMGYRVMRFTGSEICRKPFDCAREVWDAYEEFMSVEVEVAEPALAVLKIKHGDE